MKKLLYNQFQSLALKPIRVRTVTERPLVLATVTLTPTVLLVWSVQLWVSDYFWLVFTNSSNQSNQSDFLSTSPNIPERHVKSRTCKNPPILQSPIVCWWWRNVWCFSFTNIPWISIIPYDPQLSVFYLLHRQLSSPPLWETLPPLTDCSHDIFNIVKSRSVGHDRRDITAKRVLRSVKEFKHDTTNTMIWDDGTVFTISL